MEKVIVVAIILLNSYCFGAGCVERFVNYQTWPKTGISSFRAYHRAQAPWIRIFIVAPNAGCFLLQLVLLTFYRTLKLGPVAPRTMAISSAIGMLSTIMVQIPIHRQFDARGYSPLLLRRLLRTDWIRKGADLARLAATVALIWQMLRV